MTEKYVNIELKGYNRVANRFRHLASKNASALDDEFEDFATKQRRRLKHGAYPAKRPNQKYVRTGRLANSWQATKRADSQWSIKNTAPYSGYVVGKKDQAWMHKNRWWVFEDEMKKSTPELTKALTIRIVEEWDNAE